MSRRQELKERLENGLRILEAIDRRRAAGYPGAGWAIERRIVDRELRELEREWATHPTVPLRTLAEEG
ncbi:MAG: hypothetical protein RMK57_06085 [Bryobacterales bacterium]|nr:hypothetical protein [Bryobacteraceae bacterium]MDW8354084.1 hypothetical protein [Bryobacterales bacterium]